MKETKSRRREFRLAASDEEKLIEAAALVGMTVSDFVLNHAIVEADAVIDAHRTITLRPDAYKRFIEALDAPPKRLESLAKQAAKARPLKRVD
jgi:uncharacterized protein (DUF1778 family)